MKTLNEVLDSYKMHETTIDNRLGRRLCDFLTIEQMKSIGYKFDGDENNWIPKEWTEENIVAQLKEDVEFGIEKAVNHRGISAGLMQEVVIGWCWVLENGLEDSEYGWYGSETFKAVNDYYGFGLINENTFDASFYEEW